MNSISSKYNVRQIPFIALTRMSVCLRVVMLRFLNPGASIPISTPITNMKLLMMKGSTLRIGKGASIRYNVILRIGLRAKVTIAENVFINDDVTINSHTDISIGDGTIIGQNVLIYDHDHIVNAEPIIKSGFASTAVSIGKNVWIGSGTIILRGSTIGDNCIIGAGSFVKGAIPSGTLYFNKRTKNSSSSRINT